MFEAYRNKFPLSDEKWAAYTGCFRQISVPAKTILLREGEVSQRLFLIEKGCIRAWFNDDGKDITFQFFFEYSTVASIESFRKSRPSLISLETIEPSVLWWIHKKDADRIMMEIAGLPELQGQFINVLFERTFDYMLHCFSFIKDTPAKRYLTLMAEKPEVIRRVPQHYIASYLGISSVHLSRIKSSLANMGGKRKA